MGVRPFRYMPDGFDYTIAELFVVHRYRGAGAAQQAVAAVWGDIRDAATCARFAATHGRSRSGDAHFPRSGSGSFPRPKNPGARLDLSARWATMRPDGREHHGRPRGGGANPEVPVAGEADRRQHDPLDRDGFQGDRYLSAQIPCAAWPQERRYLEIRRGSREVARARPDDRRGALKICRHAAGRAAGSHRRSHREVRKEVTAERRRSRSTRPPRNSSTSLHGSRAIPCEVAQEDLKDSVNLRTNGRTSE